MAEGISSRFEQERDRIGITREALAKEAEYTVQQVRRVERGDQLPGAKLIATLAELGGDPLFVLTGRRQPADPQRLAWICHAIEAAVEEQLKVQGHANPELLGRIYNKVLSRGRSSNDDIALAKTEVAEYIESLRFFDIPEHDLAKRLLRIDPAKPPRSDMKSSGISVTGDGNQVAGGSISSGSRVSKRGGK